MQQFTMVSLSFLSSARNVLFQRVLPQPFQFHGQQIRHNWQIHLAKGRNRFTGKMAVKGDPAVWFAGANLKANRKYPFVAIVLLIVIFLSSTEPRVAHIFRFSTELYPTCFAPVTLHVILCLFVPWKSQQTLDTHREPPLHFIYSLIRYLEVLRKANQKEKALEAYQDLEEKGTSSRRLDQIHQTQAPSRTTAY
jgi:hypothetical protein